MLAVVFTAASAVFPFGFENNTADASYHFSNFKGKPPVHIFKSAKAAPAGIAPSEIKKIYKLPATGGSGTVAIIDAYDDATIEKDLGVFDAAFGLSACTVKTVASKNISWRVRRKPTADGRSKRRSTSNGRMPSRPRQRYCSLKRKPKAARIF